jgi:hypothetical protein
LVRSHVGCGGRDLFGISLFCGVPFGGSVATRYRPIQSVCASSACWRQRELRVPLRSETINGLLFAGQCRHSAVVCGVIS